MEAGAGRPVLLVHGNFAGKSWWRELLEAPPPGYRLVAPDLPGFGKSPGGKNFIPHISGYARSLARFLNHPGVERPVLVGHSFGTAIAIERALTAPEFPAMLLLSPTPLDGLHTPRYLEPILKGYQSDRRGLRRALKRTMRTRTPPYLNELVDEAGMMHPANFSGNARLISDWRMDGQLRNYTNPVLVVSGDRDSIIPPSSGEATARAFPYGAYACIPSLGHNPQIETPEKVRYLLNTLLDFTDGGPR